MSQKPTYEELEQRVKELESEAVEPKQAGEALKISEEKFSKAFHSAGPLMTISEIEDGRYIDVNDSFVRVAGYSREESVGTTSVSLGLISQEDRELLRRELETKGCVENMELTLKRKNGTMFYCLYCGEVITVGGKQRLLSIAQNITDRKRAEEELQRAYEEVETRVEERTYELARTNEELERRIKEQEKAEAALMESEARLRRFYESDIAGFARTRFSDGKLHAANDYMVRLLGYKDQETCLNEYVASEHYVDPQARKQMLDQLRKTDHAINLELPITRRDGSTIWVSYSAVRYPEKDYIELMVLDVTDRKQANEALMESERKYRTLFENVPVGVGVATVDGKIVDVNQAMCQTTGYSREEFQRLEASDVYGNNEDRELVLKRFQVDGSVKNLEVKLKRKNGTIYYANKTVVPLTLSGKSVLLTVTEDISHRKAAEEALQMAHDTLERRVGKRTSQLEAANERLERVNTGLQVLMEHRQEEIKRLQEGFVNNVNKLIMPYVEKMDKRRMGAGNRAYLEVITSNLKELVSPFVSTLSSRYVSLSPTEIQVADLVRQGKTSKEIASLFNVSANAITVHRYNIRRKLGLLNKKVNLRSYLQSLPD